MKLESLTFDRAQMDAFRRELMEHDRNLLAERIEQGADRLSKLAAQVADDRPSGDDWSAREVLAHIAVLSKFYGVTAKKIADGAWTDFDLLGHISQRDVAGEQTARLPAAEIAAMALANLRRTLEFMRAADVGSLYRRATVAEGTTMSAEEFLRLALCSHLEMHLDQLTAALEKSRPS